MCGIIGLVNSQAHPEGFTVQKMQEAMSLMAYRGPDSNSVWQHKEQPATLGHLRLSILDPTPVGTQPMHLSTANGNLSIAFNGEIYNYLELKDELTEKGYSFHTGTDTEVILASYAAWGVDCVNRFNGMFAIAIYNDKTKELTLFRDRLGIKPLYYTETEDGIAFSSEIKSLKKILNSKPELDTYLVKDYMKYGYVMGENTLEKGIKRLLPGHHLKYQNGEIKINSYWDLLPYRSNSLTFEENVKLLENEFTNSLNLRMRADVPIGVFLSGGLDSSAVVAMLSKTQKINGRLRTFSVRYDIGEYGSEYDESQYAEQVAKEFDTIHKTYTMTADDFINFIPKFVETMDEPVTEAAAISLHYVSELAKDDVTVVLSGEGSDEIFGGYDLYGYMETLEKIRNSITPTGSGFVASIANKFLPAGNKIRKYANLLAMPFEERYQGISVYDRSYHDSLYKESFSLLPDGSDYAQKIMHESRNQSSLSRMLYFDTKTWLVDDLLIKADRMSMGSSLELRVPFLDYKVVELASSMPSKFKRKGKEGKYILKKMMEPHLPKNIIYREKKGFPTPLAMMFKGPLKAYIQERLLDRETPLSEFFHTDAIENICSEHFSGKQDNHRILWQLIVLDEWLTQRQN